MRRFLDTLYWFSLWLSALCLLAIALLVGLQLLGRLVDGALALTGLTRTGFIILSLAEIAGYLLAAASFFALSGTLKAGLHIRVTLLLSALGETARRWIEVWALAASSALAAYMTWQIASFAFYSWKFHDVSPGLIPVPLAIPQAAMAVGALLLTTALIDELAVVLTGGRPSFRGAEEAFTLGKEI
jgi:TRAP-type C4-dicarboxylate transport system permease small subunit